MESSMHNLPRISHNSQLRFRQDYLRGSDDVRVMISVASCSFESRKMTVYHKGDSLRVNLQSKSLTLDNSLSSSSGMKSSITVQFSDFNVWGDEKLQGWREIARSIVSSLNTLSDKHTRALIIRTKTVICHIVNWLIDDLLFNLQRKSSTTDNQAPREWNLHRTILLESVTIHSWGFDRTRLRWRSRGWSPLPRAVLSGERWQSTSKTIRYWTCKESLRQLTTKLRNLHSLYNFLTSVFP